MNEEIDILLSRYFSGEASQTELQQLENWIAESAENEAYFDEMTLIFQHASGVKEMPEPDVDQALNSFMNYMNESESKPVVKRTITRRLIPYFSVAASIILIFGAFLFITSRQDEHIQLTVGETPLQESLFNGVEVLLAQGTEVVYSKDNKKEVTILKGEVTFDVSGEDSGQLKVLVGETFIQDIGTVFTVIAHDPEKSITVEVSEGEILFYTKDNPGISVKESEKGVYYPQENYFELIRSTVDVKAIEFDGTSLLEVIKILSTQYNVTIKTASKELNDLQISVSFDPAEPIDDILNIISQTLNIQVIKESDTSYVLSH